MEGVWLHLFIVGNHLEPPDAVKHQSYLQENLREHVAEYIQLDEFVLAVSVIEAISEVVVVISPVFVDSNPNNDNALHDYLSDEG